MPKRPGGWQRLGIVLFAGWTLFVVATGILSWPSGVVTNDMVPGIRRLKGLAALWVFPPLVVYVIVQSVRYVYRGTRPD